jgi:LysM repeat protein
VSRRRLVRLAAPAAFLLAATIAILVVRQSLRADDDGGRTTATVSTPRTTTTQPRTTTSRPALRRQQTYTVQPGDTLDQIALDFDTTVERLLEVNPQVEPTELRPGQRLRVP